MKYIDADKLKATLERQNVDKKIIQPLIRIITSLQQEQPEVDLDEEMLDYINKHYHIRYDETLEVGNDPLTTYDFEEIARYFYELGLKARKEE